MDIIVTTPKAQMQVAAREAADAIASGGGTYFRRYKLNRQPRYLCRGDRVWYVEDGWLRGSCVVTRILHERNGRVCETSGQHWPPGTYVFMDATTWQWIKPVPMTGFQGYRYFGLAAPLPDGTPYTAVEVVGGWRDAKPAAVKEKP